MKDHINYKAYNTYELFTDTESENNYRTLKLKTCEKHINLVAKEFSNQKLDVLELGSGNSKFLINLQKNNLLNKGWGIEISKNRFNFANKWINDLSISNIENINDDLINFDYNSLGELDLCVCFDLCFQFLDPIQQESDELVLKKVFSKLKSGGKIILELDYCGYIINNLPYTKRIWDEFADQDPWKYSLWDCDFDRDRKILNWNKIFISRKNEYDSTSVSLKIYNKSDIENLLNKVGFKNVRIYQDFNYTKFEQEKGEFLIIAEK